MRKIAILALAAATLTALAVSQAGFTDRVLLNQSPSAPTGFYLRTDRPIARGAFVTVRAVDVAPDYARLRRFTDGGDRFIKRVAATEGQRVCAEHGAVTLGGVRLERLSHDSSGAVLPSWNGCRVLAENEVFLVGDTADSFDSRYFGVVRVDQIEGVWRPL